MTTTGMIYAATTAGLVMRDGNAAPTAAWTTISGAPNNTVQALASNGDEWLYVGTTAGIARYNRQTQTWGTTYNTANQAALPSNDITSLDVAADGKVYIGTSAGVAIWNTVTNTWQGPYTSSNSAMNSNAVRQIYANSQGIVYTLTSLPTLMTITPTDLTVWNPTNPTVLLHHYDVTHDFAGYRASDFYLNPSDTALYLGQQSGGLVRINLS